jgi:hypothetical protein
MLLDERTYQIRPGCMAAYLARHREIALPLMRHYLGEPLAYFTSVEGELNQFVHLWLYRDAADREQRRGRMYADPRWLAYREDTGATGWVLHQRNRLLQSISDVGRLGELSGVLTL